MLRREGPDGVRTSLSRRITLGSLLGGRRGGSFQQAYAEEEVRDMIYGWRGGAVERPEPRDSTPPPLGGLAEPTRPV
jgi:hypothetical protein